MEDHTTKPHVAATVTNLLLRGLSAIGSKIFQSDDSRARDRGWQIVPRYGGLSRSYRDPRFDYLLTCAACNGHGCNRRDGTCSACRGAGRIILSPSAASEPGRGQP